MAEDSEKRKKFQQLFDAHYMRLLCHARHFLSTDEEAEDIVEDVFFELWQNRHKLDFNGRMLGYLYQAVSTRSLNALRRKGTSAVRIDILESIDEMRIEHLVTREDQSHNMERAELVHQIQSAIASLPDKCREVFKLSYLHGLRNRDIAEAMDISVRTVDAHIYKALRLLREKLSYLLTFIVLFPIFC